MRNVIIAIVSVIALIVIIASCNHSSTTAQPVVQNAPASYPAAYAPTTVNTYQGHDSNGDLLFYYMMFSNFGGHSHSYYYSSPTPVTNFSNVNMVDASRTPIPPEFQKSVEDGKQVSTATVPQSQLPPVEEEEEKAAGAYEPENAAAPAEQGFQPSTAEQQTAAAEQAAGNNAPSTPASATVEDHEPAQAEPVESHEAAPESSNESSGSESSSSSSESSSSDSGGSSD